MRRKFISVLLVLVMVLASVSAFAASTGASSIEFDNYSIVMTSGSIYTLNVSIKPSDLKLKASDLVWTSDDTRVATVSNGTIRSKVNGGCVITATDPNTGVSAKCYVGVGAPYGYVNYSYYDYYYNPYNNPYYYNYTGDFVPAYYYPNTASGIYPYGYYSGTQIYSATKGEYYTMPSYYNYYNLPSNYGSYVNQYGQIVYTTGTPSSVSYVQQGSATNASQFAQEVKQGAQVLCNNEVRGFGFVDEGSTLIVVPDYTSKEMTNTLQLPGNTLNRLSKFNYDTIQYNLPNLEISLYPALNKSSSTVLKVTGKSNYDLDDALHGPWEFDINSDKNGLGLRFILDRNYSKTELELVRLNEKTGKFVAVDRNSWKLTSQTRYNYTIYSLRTDLVSSGTYAVIAK